MAEREWAGRLAGEEVCLMILTTSFIRQLLQAEGGRVLKGRGREAWRGSRKNQELERKREMGKEVFLS